MVLFGGVAFDSLHGTGDVEPVLVIFDLATRVIVGAFGVWIAAIVKAMKHLRDLQ